MNRDKFIKHRYLVRILCVFALLACASYTTADSFSQDETKRLNSAAAIYLYGDSSSKNVISDYELSTVEEPSLIRVPGVTSTVGNIVSIRPPQLVIKDGRATFKKPGEPTSSECYSQPILFIDEESGRLIRFVSHEFLLDDDSIENQWAHLPVSIEEGISYSVGLSASKPFVGAVDLVGALFGERPLLGGEIGCPVFEAFYLENDFKDEFKDLKGKSAHGQDVPYWYFVIYRQTGSSVYTEHVKISRGGEEITRSWNGLESLVNAVTHFKKPVDSISEDSAERDSSTLK